MSSSGEVEGELFCAEASLRVGEPLAGTAAAGTSRWLVLEQTGPWGPKGVEDSALPPELVAYLHALGKSFPSLRVQLIRRHERDSEATPRVFLASTDEGMGTLHQLPLPALSSLVHAGLEAWLERGLLPERALMHERPIYLVCAHGKRDRCCAQRGMPLYSALRELSPDQVWQTTHLGGHRFAATMVVLPHGICYGRLSEADAVGLHAAHEGGAFHELGKVRGRTCYEGPAQAAEVLLRERLGERRLDVLKLLSVQSSEKTHRVRFADLRSAGEHVVELEHVALPPAPASCGAKAKASEGLVQLRTHG
jgi:hypothetical protein